MRMVRGRLAVVMATVWSGLLASRVFSAGPVSPGDSPLLFSRTAPDPVGLMCPQREREAFALYRAARADPFRLDHLLQALARVRDREEQFGVGELARGGRSPVLPGGRPRRPARESGICSSALF